LLMTMIHAEIFSDSDKKGSDRPKLTLIADDFEYFCTEDFERLFNQKNQRQSVRVRQILAQPQYIRSDKDVVLANKHAVMNAEKMRITFKRDIDVYPSIDFGFGKVEFDPEKVKEVYNNLQRFFYETQKHGTISSVSLDKVAQFYARVTACDFYPYSSEKCEE